MEALTQEKIDRIVEARKVSYKNNWKQAFSFRNNGIYNSNIESDGINYYRSGYYNENRAYVAGTTVKVLWDEMTTEELDVVKAWAEKTCPKSYAVVRDKYLIKFKNT